jgi:ribulose 1,5-bisphosphate carboxylase large subunit-like protein
MEFNLDGIKQEPDIFVEIHAGFTAGTVRTSHSQHILKLNALEKKLRELGVDALCRDGRITIETKKNSIERRYSIELPKSLSMKD